MTDLIKRLRDPSTDDPWTGDDGLFWEAADEIERLADSFQWRLELEVSEARKKITERDVEIARLNGLIAESKVLFDEIFAGTNDALDKLTIRTPE